MPELVEPGAQDLPASPERGVDVDARLDQLTAQVAELGQLFETRILHSTAESEINARLHAELQTYKNDLYGKLVKPILHDLIAVREHILRLVAVQSELPAESQAVKLATFASFGDDLAQILEENEVSIHHAAPGAAYETGLHQISAKVDTADPAVHRTIATVSGDGYSFQGRVLVPQRVTVFAYRTNLDGESS